MNKKLIKDIIKLKKLEYEIFKEVLPNSLKAKVEKVEEKTINFATEIAVEILKDSMINEKEEEKKSTKKISIDF